MRSRAIIGIPIAAPIATPSQNDGLILVASEFDWGGCDSAVGCDESGEDNDIFGAFHGLSFVSCGNMGGHFTGEASAISWIVLRSGF